MNLSIHTGPRPSIFHSHRAAALGRLAIVACGTIALAAALSTAPAQAILAGGSGALIAWAGISWRTRPIVQAAKDLAHAFCLTNKPCIDETRAVSRAVFLGE